MSDRSAFRLRSVPLTGAPRRHFELPNVRTLTEQQEATLFLLMGEFRRVLESPFVGTVTIHVGGNGGFDKTNDQLNAKISLDMSPVDGVHSKATIEAVIQWRADGALR